MTRLGCFTPDFTALKPHRIKMLRRVPSHGRADIGEHVSPVMQHDFTHPVAQIARQSCVPAMHMSGGTYPISGCESRGGFEVSLTARGTEGSAVGGGQRFL